MQKHFQTTDGRCKQNTHSNSMCRCAQCVTPHTEQNDHISSREHAWLKIAHLCVSKIVVIHVSCLCSLPHLTLTTSTSSLSPTSPIFPTFSPLHPSPLAHDPYLPCEDPRHCRINTNPISHTFCACVEVSTPFKFNKISGFWSSEMPSLS